MYMLVKIISSATIIGVVTEIARRFPTYGGIILRIAISEYFKYYLADGAK